MSKIHTKRGGWKYFFSHGFNIFGAISGDRNTEEEINMLENLNEDSPEKTNQLCFTSSRERKPKWLKKEKKSFLSKFDNDEVVKSCFDWVNISF